jgi:hypothetical protein
MWNGRPTVLSDIKAVHGRQYPPTAHRVDTGMKAHRIKLMKTIKDHIEEANIN